MMKTDVPCYAAAMCLLSTLAAAMAPAKSFADQPLSDAGARAVQIDLAGGRLEKLAPDQAGRLRLERNDQGYVNAGQFLSKVRDLGDAGSAEVRWLAQWTAPQRWEKHDKNPIYGPQQSGAWDGWTNGVSIVRTADGKRYRMYYSGRKGAGIGFAEASVEDPLTWKEHPASPVLKPRSNWEGNLLNQPRVVRVTDKHWRMYYTGWGFKGIGSPWAMGLAESHDEGVTWKRFSDDPILKRGGEDSPDGAGVFVPSLLRVDGKWMMWYTAMKYRPGFQNIHLCLATSDDGIHWTKHEKNPVLTDDFTQGPKRNVLSRCCVRHDGGVFRIWYSHAKPDYRIHYAESLDGVDWERGPIAPVLDVSPGGAWDNRMVEYPEVDVHHGEYRLWFCGNGFGTVGYAKGMVETDLSVELRTGGSAAPDGSWSDWKAVQRDKPVEVKRYAQLRVRIQSKNPKLSPALNELELVLTGTSE